MTTSQKSIIAVLAFIAICALFAFAIVALLFVVNSRPQSISSVQEQSTIPPPITETAVPPPSASTPEILTPTLILVSGPFTDIDQLIAEVVGDKLTDVDFMDWGDGGYDIDIAIADSHNVSRQEMLMLTYNLHRAFHYDFPTNTGLYISLHLRPGSLDEPCSFGSGLGNDAAPKFLPEQAPDDLNIWYQKLVKSGYYADLPSEKVELMAYANDPASQKGCEGFSEWR